MAKIKVYMTADKEEVVGIGSSMTANGFAITDLDERVTVLEETAGSAVPPEIEVDLSEYATIVYVDESIGNLEIPDITNLASKEEVNTAINNIPKVDLTPYAKKDEIPDTSNLASKEEVNEAISNIDIPDISNLATIEQVNEAISSIDIPEIDLSNYATKDEIPEAVDLTPYATTEQVNEAIAAIDFPEPDLSNYATKNEIPDITNLATWDDISPIAAQASLLTNEFCDDKVEEGIRCVIDHASAGNYSTYTSSSFTGFAGLLGRPKNIHKIELGLFARENVPISEIQVQIYKPYQTYEELTEITKNGYNPWKQETLYEATITLDEPITNIAAPVYISHELTTPILNNSDWLMMSFTTTNKDVQVSARLKRYKLEDKSELPYNFYGWYTSRANLEEPQWLYYKDQIDFTDIENDKLVALDVRVYEEYRNEWTEVGTEKENKFFNKTKDVIENLGLGQDATRYFADNLDFSSVNLFEEQSLTKTQLTSTFTGAAWFIGKIDPAIEMKGVRLPIATRMLDGTGGTASKVFVNLYEVDRYVEYSSGSAGNKFTDLNPVKLATGSANVNISVDDGIQLVDIMFDAPAYNSNNKILMLGFNLDTYCEKCYIQGGALQSYLNAVDPTANISGICVMYYSTKKVANETWAWGWSDQYLPGWTFIDSEDFYDVGTEIKNVINETITKQTASLVEELATEAVNEILENYSPVRGQINLAQQYDLVVGDTFQLFYDGCIKSFEAQNPDALGLVCTCAKGASYPRYWEFTPAASDVGTYTLTMTLRNLNGSIMHQGTTKIVVHDLPTYDTEKELYMLGFGDSLTSAGTWYGEGIRRLIGTATEGVSGPASLQIPNLSITTYGKKGNTVNTHPTRHEGYGGWTWGSFLSTEQSGSTTNGIIVTLENNHGYVLDDVQKSIWVDNNGKNWELEDFPADNKIKFNRGNGNTSAQKDTTLPTVLTCSNLSLTLDTFTVEWESGNPFYDEELKEINFITHATECGAPRCDIAACLLTWNAGGPSTTDLKYQSKITTHMSNAATLLRKFHTDFPDAKIICMGIQLSSVTGGTGANYGSSGNYSDALGTIFYAHDYNKALENLVTNDEFKDYCYYVDTKAQFDTVNMMPYSNVAVNTRSTATEKRGTNGVHPSTGGYYQIGDAFFRTLVRVLNDLNT